MEANHVLAMDDPLEPARVAGGRASSALAPAFAIEAGSERSERDSRSDPSGNGPADGELMARAAAGDRGAFGELVDRHKRALLAYLGRVCGSHERAEELAQEAFVRLYQAAPGYRDEGRLLPYLFRIAVNLVRSEARRHGRWRLLLPVYAHGRPTCESAGDEALLRAELQARVRRELQRLPLRYRLPLLLFEVEEWSYADIARALDCREGTVKSRIHRGRERLRRALTPYLQEGLG